MVNSFQLNWKGVGLTFWQMVLLRLCWMCCCKMTRLPLCWLDCLGSAVYPVNAFPYVPCVPPPYYFPIYSDPISHCISHLTLFERKFHRRGSINYPTLLRFRSCYRSFSRFCFQTVQPSFLSGSRDCYGICRKSNYQFSIDWINSVNTQHSKITGEFCRFFFHFNVDLRLKNFNTI